MRLKVYDLVDHTDGVNFSSFGWRVRLCLKHKDLLFEKVDLTFHQIQTEIPKISNNKWKLTPLLVDDDEVVANSRDIAEYLEDKYSDRPLLFPNGKEYSFFLENYISTHMGKLFNLCVLHIYDNLHGEDKVYFKNLRETQFNKPLEQIAEEPGPIYLQIFNALKPFISTLKTYKYLEGETVTYSDYLLFGTLQWVRILAPIHFDNIIGMEAQASEDTPVLLAWFNSIAHLYSEYANDTPIYH
ncbi:hypothetical protein K502DRAFT_339667 [Neoconidiobolus thromboides FSU 785]|nr:hypothetical protein K502DRAFT_339667 [Neoconidiobolus thromboides FSU 785]